MNYMQVRASVIILDSLDFYSAILIFNHNITIEALFQTATLTNPPILNYLRVTLAYQTSVF